jgi:hypothetical protein
MPLWSCTKGFRDSKLDADEHDVGLI